MTDLQHVDGNVAGGILGQIFTAEMTTAQATCAGCGRDGSFGEATVYATAMGTIIRCPGCGDALIRLVQGPQRIWADFSGTRLILLRQAE